MIDKEQLAAKLNDLIAETEKKITGYEEMSAPVSPDDAIGRVSRMDAINNKAVAEAIDVPVTEEVIVVMESDS